MKANRIKKKLGKNFFTEASSTFIMTSSFPESSTFLIWRPAPTTIAIAHRLRVQKFAPVATGQKLTATLFGLMHTLNTWLQGEKLDCLLELS